jgi:hypothetical protein
MIQGPEGGHILKMNIVPTTKMGKTNKETRKK